MKTNSSTKPIIGVANIAKEVGIPTRVMQTFVRKKMVPYLHCGFRTLIFYPDRVREALDRFEVKAIGSK